MQTTTPISSEKDYDQAAARRRRASRLIVAGLLCFAALIAVLAIASNIRTGASDHTPAVTSGVFSGTDDPDAIIRPGRQSSEDQDTTVPDAPSPDATQVAAIGPRFENCDLYLPPED